MKYIRDTHIAVKDVIKGANKANLRNIVIVGFTYEDEMYIAGSDSAVACDLMLLNARNEIGFNK